MSTLADFQRDKTPKTLASIMAQTSTRYPQEALISVRCNLSGALDCIAALLIAAHFAPWQNDTLVRSIGLMAYTHKYEGQWLNVQMLLENEEQTADALERKTIELYGPRPYYGNILPRVEKVLRRCKLVDTTKRANHPVRRTQRHRGYRDKGSCRLPHEFHGDPPEKQAREDRRPNINHPLLRRSTEDENSMIGIQPGTTSPRKEEKT